MGLRSLDDGYVPPILDVSKLDRKLLVSNAESVAAVRALLDQGRHPRGRLGRRRRARRAADRRRAARGLDRRRASSPTAAGSTSPPTSGSADDVERVDGDDALVVVPDAIRAELRAHAEEEAPNECCGVIVFRTASPSATSAAATCSPRRTATSSRSTPRCGSSRTRRLRAGRLPLAPGDRAEPVADRPRAVGPVGRQDVPDLRAEARRAARVEDHARRRRGASDLRVLRPVTLRA